MQAHILGIVRNKNNDHTKIQTTWPIIEYVIP